jgi:hypothetical protein
MDLELHIDSAKADYEAKKENDEVVPGEPLFVVTFHPVALTRAEYLELVEKAKDHSIVFRSKDMEE